MDKLKSSLTQILERMNISKVYHIDDFYEEGALDLDIFLSQINSSSIDQIQKICISESILTDEFNPDIELTKALFRKHWDTLSPSQKIKLKETINVDYKWDLQASRIIENLFESTKIQKLSPSQWETDKNDILSTLNSEKLLFLFDNNWGDTFQNSGITTIQQLLLNATIQQDNFMCGLFTHTVLPQEEYKKRCELTNTYKIEDDKFLVISKQHEEKSFVSSLRTTALLPTLLLLKKKIYEHIKNATSIIEENFVKELDIVDLEYIAMEKTKQEGEWEPNIIYRIHKNKHLSKFKNNILNDPSTQECISIIREIRKISATEAPISPTPKTKELMYTELYDTSINQYNCPLKLGDIFQIKNKYYILLNQPCDLMIRSDGKRSFDEHKIFANLVQIQKANDGPKNTQSILLDYFLNSEDKYIVSFPEMHQIEFNILDLSTYHIEGKCEIDLTKKECVPHRLQSITNRYKYIHRDMEKKFEFCLSLLKQAKLLKDIKKISDKNKLPECLSAISSDITTTDIREQLIKSLFSNGTLSCQPKIEDHSKKLRFEVQRVSRLSQEKANEILLYFTYYHSRPAHQLDFWTRKS